MNIAWDILITIINAEEKEKNIFVIKFILNSVMKEFIKSDNIDKFFSIIYTYTHT